MGSTPRVASYVYMVRGQGTRPPTPSEEVLELDDFFLGPKPSLFPRRGRAHVASLHRPTLGGPELDLTTLKACLDLAKQRRENTRTQPCCQGDRRSPSCRLPTADCRCAMMAPLPRSRLKWLTIALALFMLLMLPHVHAAGPSATSISTATVQDQASTTQETLPT